MHTSCRMYKGIILISGYAMYSATRICLFFFFCQYGSYIATMCVVHIPVDSNTNIHCNHCVAFGFTAHHMHVSDSMRNIEKKMLHRGVKWEKKFLSSFVIGMYFIHMSCTHKFHTNKFCYIHTYTCTQYTQKVH